MQKNYQNRAIKSERGEEKIKNQEFFFPDINGQSVTVKANNMREAEEIAKHKTKKTK